MICFMRGGKVGHEWLTGNKHFMTLDRFEVGCLQGVGGGGPCLPEGNYGCTAID